MVPCLPLRWTVLGTLNFKGRALYAAWYLLLSTLILVAMEVMLPMSSLIESMLLAMTFTLTPITWMVNDSRFVCLVGFTWVFCIGQLSSIASPPTGLLVSNSLCLLQWLECKDSFLQPKLCGSMGESLVLILV